MHRLIERAGEEPFEEHVVAALSEPIDDSIVDIRPDKLIYVSHAHYRNRLDSAFGVGGWALVPLGAPRIEDNRVIYYGFLKAHGRFIADAVGGHDYQPKNKGASYDNSVEAAKSDCLVRCCKALPMFRECWDKDYADAWVQQYAEQAAHPWKTGEKIWVKRTDAKRNFDRRPGRASESEWRRPPRVEDENQAHIDSIEGNRPLLVQRRDEYNDNEPGYNEWKEGD